MKKVVIFSALILALIACKKEKEETQKTYFVDTDKLRVHTVTFYTDLDYIQSMQQYSYYPDGTIKRKRDVQISYPTGDTSANNRIIEVTDYYREENQIRMVTFRQDYSSGNSTTDTTILSLNSDGLAYEAIVKNANDTTPERHFLYSYDTSGYMVSSEEYWAVTGVTTTTTRQIDQGNCVFLEEVRNVVSPPYTVTYTHDLSRSNTFNFGEFFYGRIDKNPVLKASYHTFHTGDYDVFHVYTFKEGRIVKEVLNNSTYYTLYTYLDL